MKMPVPRTVCADGFSLSVQASQFHYCTPRDDEGPYTHVEVGYPSERCEELMPYVENEDEPTQTVYAYVPIETVEELIAHHGGRA